MDEKEILEAKLPGGFWVRVFGKHTIYAITVIALFAYMFFINYTIAQDHLSISKELRINTYILSLPQDKRPELIPPPEVWERMRATNPLNRLEPLERIR